MSNETGTYEQRIDSELAELEGYLQGLETLCCGNASISIPGEDLFSLINMATEKVRKARAICPTASPEKTPERSHAKLVGGVA